MVLYITKYCTHAVIQRDGPSIETVEVIPERGEEHWKRRATWYIDGLQNAIHHADILEAVALYQRP